MHRMISTITILAGLAGCVDIIDIPRHVGVDLQVTGQVHGLWQGVDGVAVKLLPDGFDPLYTVSSNGEFKFSPLPLGTRYRVEIATSPLHHTCDFDSGSSGTVMNAGMTGMADISISCTGPGTVTISSPFPDWIFDPTLSRQLFEAPVDSPGMVHVVFTVSGAVTFASIGDVDVVVKQELPMDLRLPTPLYITLVATGGLSMTYKLVFDFQTENVKECSSDRMRCTPH